MSREFTVYDVLIASPTDVVEERMAVAEVIEDWNSANAVARGILLRPLRWELDAVPASGDRPQAIINEQLVDGADVIVAVFWSRLGTPTGKALSGTAEEIEELRTRGKHVLVYFSEAPIPANHDPAQWHALKEYRHRLPNTLYSTFLNKVDLQRQVAKHIANTAYKLKTSPAKAHDADLLNLDNYDDIDVRVIASQTVLVPYGSTLAAELLDRPAAEMVRDRINAEALKISNNTRFHRAIVTTDAAWFKYSSLKSKPLISVGGEDANSVTPWLTSAARNERRDCKEWNMGQGTYGVFSMATPKSPQAALFGKTAGQTRQAVEAYLEKPEGLKAFLKICWA